MSDHIPAFEVSPVPVPAPDAVAPEPFRGIYGMPSFVTIGSTDLAASIEFWTRGLGFFDLFSVPGRLVHLRRWIFQDVLLVPAEAPGPRGSGIRVTFACVLNQIDAIATSCREVGTGTVHGVVDTAWNTRDLEVTTPEGVQVVCTAAKPFDPSSDAARSLEAIGITPPTTEGDHTVGRD